MTEYKAGDVVLANWGGGHAECVVELVDAWRANGMEQILLHGYWRYRAGVKEKAFRWGPIWVTSALSKPHPTPDAVRADLVKQLVREAADRGERA
jgi:hypothetical protein